MRSRSPDLIFFSSPARRQRIFGVSLLLLCFATGAVGRGLQAKDLYLRAGAAGGAGGAAVSGASWAEAYPSLAAVRWGTGPGALGAGDTLWVAAGTYPGSLVPAASGAGESARILVKRARAADGPACTGAPGWSAALEGPVVFAGGVRLAVTPGTGSFLTLDGQGAGGIRVVCANDDGAAVSLEHAVEGLTLRDLDLAGPGGATPIEMHGDNRCLDATAWNGSEYEAIRGLRLEGCWLHGCVNLLWLMNVHESTIERCRFYDSAAANSAQWHANVCATAYSTAITWRYNEITNWQVEGIMFLFGGAAHWAIYGNVWHDGMGGPTGNTHRVLEVQDAVQGPVFFSDNTVANVNLSIRRANGGTFSADSAGANNVFWNTSGPEGFPNLRASLIGGENTQAATASAVRPDPKMPPFHASRGVGSRVVAGGPTTRPDAAAPARRRQRRE